MPNYANIEDVAREHAQRAGGPGFIAGPGERTYSIYPQGLGGAREEYWPTETAGVPDWRSTTLPGGEMVSPEIDIENMPQQDYELGRITVKRQYTDDVKIADGYPPGSPQYITLHEEAKATMNSRLAKLQMDFDRTEIKFKEIRQNPNFSQEEQFTAKHDWYDANPVWGTPRIKYPEERTAAEMMAELLKEGMAGVTAPTEEEIKEPSFWERTFGGRGAEPAVRPVIEPSGEPVTAPTRPAREVLPTPEQIAEYKRLGGRETVEGRKYARDFVEAVEKRPRITTPAGLPPKPIGYPDAVWNTQHKMWTIIKGGKLVGLTEK